MSTLYEELINPKLRKGRNGEEFWGKYNNLDNPGPPTTRTFLEIQIDALQALESSNNLKYQEVNKFLEKVPKIFYQSSENQENIAEQAYPKIVELMNAGLRGSPMNPYKKAGKLELENELEIIKENIESISEKIGIDKEISEKIVQMLNDRLKNFNWKDPSPQSYIKEKADLLENLMVAEINKNENLKAYVTGKWVDDSGKQLIEDSFVFQKGDKNLSTQFGKELSYSLKVDGKKENFTASSIQDFLEKINKIDKIEITVHLSDELYEALQKGAILAGQAKSGLSGQNILNKNKRNNLKLQDINFKPIDLWNLYNEDLQSKTKYFKPYNIQNSKVLEALTNYCLSTNIAKTALTKNQIYLTADGFVTASQWMEKYKRYLIFSPGITKINKDFLTDERPYAFNETNWTKK